MTVKTTATDQQQKPAARRDSGMTLTALRTFIATAEANSVSAAAAQLGVAQPTVSIQLNNLEQACGFTLFYRRPKFRLTDPGKEFLLRARQALSRFDSLEAYTDSLRSMSAGRLSVGMSTPAFAMPMLASFMRRMPGIGVRSSVGNTSTLIEDLNECKVDVAVMSLDAELPGMDCTLVAPQRLRVCLPSDHPLALAGKPVHIEQLVEYPFLMRETGSMTRKIIESAFAQRGCAPNVYLEVGSREALKEGVAAGMGVSVVLEGEARGDLRLVDLPLAGTTACGGVYAVALKEAADIPSVAAFLEHAISFFSP